MVDFVALAQTAEDADGVFHRGFIHHHGLEATLKGGILLDVLPELVQSGRADGMQFATGEHRFQHVGGVDGPFGRTGAHHGVQFVDEEHDLALRVGHFLQHSLQSFFEFAAELRAGDECTHVERHDLAITEGLGHVATYDALGESFDDCGFANTGLADEHGIVLRAT